MKSQFVWNVPGVSTDPDEFVNIMKKANIDTVIIWACDGSIVANAYGAYASFGRNLTKTLVDKLHEAGILVLGWGAVYGNSGNSPQAEGKIAGEVVEELGLDGYVFDVESTADSQSHPDSDGAHRCIEYKKVTDKPLYLCWWIRYKNPDTGGQWHPDNITAKQLLSTYDLYVDGYMPMCYWYSTTSDPDGIWWSENMLRQGFSQYREVTQKPIIPIGRAYNGDGGTVTIEAMYKFAETATELECAGLSWWSAEHAIKLTGIYDAIGEIHGQTDYTVPESNTTDQEEEVPNGNNVVDNKTVKTTSAMYLRNKDNEIVGKLNKGAVIDVVGEGVQLVKNGTTFDMLEISAQCAEMYTEEV